MLTQPDLVARKLTIPSYMMSNHPGNYRNATQNRSFGNFPISFCLCFRLCAFSLLHHHHHTGTIIIPEEDHGALIISCIAAASFLICLLCTLCHRKRKRRHHRQLGLHRNAAHYDSTTSATGISKYMGLYGWLAMIKVEAVHVLGISCRAPNFGNLVGIHSDLVSASLHPRICL